MNHISPQFQEILDAAKEKRGDLPVDTMIVQSHLAQMRLFILRRGVEFFCDQDSFGGRVDFLRKVYDENMLEMKLESIIDYFLCDGQGLFYFRPSGESYQLLYFPKDSYRAYRDQNGELTQVELIYSFAVKEPMMMDPYAMPNQRGGRKKYIRLRVYKDKIEQQISNEKIEFDNDAGMPTMSKMGETTELTNSLGFIPAVEVYNHLDCTGEATGSGEFDAYQNQILFHDELVRNVRKNMKFFGNPTLVSSRPRHDILDSGEEGNFKPTISSQAGFYDASRPSTRVSQPFGSAGIDGQIKVPRVIANLEPTDRVSYMTPDAVSGDQNLYIKQYRSEIRLALGGVDDIDIGTASTAYEMKSLYGRVSATADKKAKALFDFGLCKLLSMMIQHEEYLFIESFASAMELVKPEIPLEENFNGDLEAYSEAISQYQKDQSDYIAQRTTLLDASMESGQIPDGVTGLIPDGNSKVNWRYTGDIFEEDSQGILNNSIVVRNLQELGVDSIEALKYLFPSKTDEERSAMLTGYPFRMVQQSQQAFNTFIGMLGQLYQLPHPQMPDQPLAADPNLDITGFLYRSLEFLRKELSYSGKYSTDDGDFRPSTLSAADRKRAQLGLPIRDERPVELPGGTPGSGSQPAAPGLPDGSGPAGFGTSSESMAGRVPGAQRQPEYAASVPGPGTVLGLSDTDTSGQYPGSMGFPGPFGSPDLRAPSFNPGLFGPGSASATTTTAGPDSQSGPNSRRK
nr:hypothetical protein 99 [Pelagibacteraceae bacterium]